MLNRIAIFISMLAFTACTSLIRTAEKKIASYNISSSINDSIVLKTLKNYTIVFKINSEPTGSGSKNGLPIYYLGFGNNKCLALKLDGSYLRVNGVYQVVKKTDSIHVSVSVADSLLRLFKKNKHWNLIYDDRDTAAMYCFWKSGGNKNMLTCEINDGPIYTLSTFTKSSHTISHLYAPGFYENKCCQGNINRLSFLKIKKVLDDM